jgi:hypothetical protein
MLCSPSILYIVRPSAGKFQLRLNFHVVSGPDTSMPLRVEMSSKVGTAIALALLIVLDQFDGGFPLRQPAPPPSTRFWRSARAHKRTQFRSGWDQPDGTICRHIGGYRLPTGLLQGSESLACQAAATVQRWKLSIYHGGSILLSWQGFKSPNGNWQSLELVRRCELKGCRPTRIVDLKLDRARAYSRLKLSFALSTRVVEVRLR